MYCRNCGNKLENDAVVCPKCGQSTSKKESHSEQTQSGFGWGVLAFFIPIVGLILAVAYFNKRKEISYGSCKGVLVRTCISIFVSIIIFLIELIYILTGAQFLPNIPSVSPSVPPISGTGPNWDKFPPSDTPDTSFVYPLPPEPLQATYNNSDDGVLTFNFTESNRGTVYDVSTNQIIAYDQFNICVYETASGIMLYEESYSMPIACVAAYGGKVAVGFGDYRNIVVLNLTTFSSQTYSTTIAVFDIELTNNAVIYVNNDQHCTVRMLSLENGTDSVVIDSIYEPSIAVNVSKNILYAAEKNLSSCDLLYVNLATLQSSTKTEFSQYYYNRYDVMYDGTYLHAMGNLYDPIKGNIVSAGQYFVKNQEGWQPYSTLCTDGEYSLTVTTDCKTAVYNSESKKIEYTMDLYATRIYAIGNNKYVALCGSSGYYALIDLNKM